MMPENYDYTQELARAAFADMLHDSERNEMYRAGLIAAIKKVRSRGDTVRVLDIGTGTGLLSMMAAVEGVDSIVACEEFRPMAECAAKVIEANGFRDNIKLVRKRSTELTVGPGCDMEERANILVTEVFDTELIGEGAIGTYNHANRDLLTQDRLVVPGVARMFAQAVTSSKASTWSRLHDIELEDGGAIKTGDNLTISNLVLHDVQLSELDETLFTPLSPPMQVFEFDLACYSAPIKKNDKNLQKFKALNSGLCTAVFMWWDCFTDPDHTVLLSCAPKWSHPNPASMPWRDHWMQAIYYPTSEIAASAGEELLLHSNHDEYSLWFDVTTAQEQSPATNPPVYLPMSRTRLGELNSRGRNLKYSQALTQILADLPDARVLVLGDQSTLGLLAAKHNVSSVTVVQENKNMVDVLRNLANENNIQHKLQFLPDLEKVEGKFDLVLGDSFYTISILPWHNLLYWFQIRSIKQRDLLADAARVVPGHCSLWLVPVHYHHLWKIRAPLNNIQGFNMKYFDKIIEEASENSDSNVEPQPLWEYPCTALGPPVKVRSFDLNSIIPSAPLEMIGDIPVQSNAGELNGLALWCDWELVPGLTLSSGPVSDIVVGEKIDWSMDHKQGVHFIKPQDKKTPKVMYHITFDPTEGDFIFDFKA